jgi:hypothetical protein
MDAAPAYGEAMTTEEAIAIDPGSGNSGAGDRRRPRAGASMSRTVLHPGLTVERWQRMSLAEQLSNIGTEVARAARARALGNGLRLQQHFGLVLELFEFTLDDDRWRGQREEIGRSRELVCDYLVGENEHGSTAETLDAYFLPFAYLVLRAAQDPAATFSGPAVIS